MKHTTRKKKSKYNNKTCKQLGGLFGLFSKQKDAEFKSIFPLIHRYLNTIETMSPPQILNLVNSAQNFKIGFMNSFKLIGLRGLKERFMSGNFQITDSEEKSIISLIKSNFGIEPSSSSNFNMEQGQ